MADVDVLARQPVFPDRPLDQLVDLVGAEDGGMAEPAVLAVTPGELDFPVVTAVEIPAEQVVEVAQHLLGIGLDHRLDIGIGHRGRLT